MYRHFRLARYPAVWKEGNVLFNDALNTFYLRLNGVGHMVQNHSDSEREETRCRHMGYSFRLTARVLLYAPSHRQDSTYHSLCYTSRGALGGTRNSSMRSTMKDRCDDPSQHERTLLPRSVIEMCNSRYRGQPVNPAGASRERMRNVPVTWK